MLKTCRLRSGDFPPRVLHQLSPPLEGGARGGPSRRPYAEGRSTAPPRLLLVFVLLVPPSTRRGGQAGLLKTCRLRSGDFPPRVLHQLSPPLEGGARGGPSQRQHTERRSTAPPRLLLIFVLLARPSAKRGGQAGLLKTCRLRSGDFPPRVLHQLSPPLEGGARGGPSQRPYAESRSTAPPRLLLIFVLLARPSAKREGQAGLLKTCRLRSGDFPPRMLHQLSPPSEGGARGGPPRRPHTERRVDRTTPTLAHIRTLSPALR